MARIRSVKPEFFLHEELTELSALHRLLFIGLWCLADRDGRLEDRPKRIKIELLPWDDCDIEQLLTDLAAGGFITRYEVDGLRLISIPNFRKHQRITGKEAETPSKFPPPPSENQSGNTGETPGETEGKHLGSQEGGKRKEEGKGDHAAPHAHARVRKIVQTLEAHLFVVDGPQKQTILSELDDPAPRLRGDPDLWAEWICLAIKEAADYGKRNLKYLQRIIQTARETQLPPGSGSPAKGVKPSGNSAQRDAGNVPQTAGGEHGSLTARLRERDAGMSQVQPAS